MSGGIPVSHCEGRISRQAHADLPEGTFEREVGREGFFGPAAHFYHSHPPTAWERFDGPLRPRAFDSLRSGGAGSTPWQADELLSNEQLRYRIWRLDRSMPHLARNADGDDLLFVHEGRADLYCDYGHLYLRDGDYLVLPRGTMWRLEVDAPVRALLIEATGSAYSLADRGLLGAHALFEPAPLDVPRLDPAFRAQQGEREWTVDIKSRQQVSNLTYAFNPLDAVGWKGTLAPVRLNWRDIRPITSERYHLPPSGHSTFVANGFVVCTFCPRPLESDPSALRLPFYHSNDDYDEVLFYHAGHFMSRDDVRAGSITWHPAGVPHGPHPKALAAAVAGQRSRTDEVAVMLDARGSLEAGDACGSDREHAAAGARRLGALRPAARGAELPESFWSDLLMYQGGSDGLLGPCDPIVAGAPEWSLDFEAELVVITGDVPRGADARVGAEAIRLFVLVNNISLRGQIPGELAKGFGFIHGKPPTAFSPVAVTAGEPTTPFLSPGERVRIEMLDAEGRSVFGAIDQPVVSAPEAS